MEKTPLISWNKNHDIEICNEIFVNNKKIGIIQFNLIVKLFLLNIKLFIKIQRV